MSMQIKCPNGHRLVASESNAGKTGKCPVCKAPVSIPSITEQLSAVTGVQPGSSFSDSIAIAAMLGPPPQRVARNPVPDASAASGESSPASPRAMQHMKRCPNCSREIDIGYHVCPHCHTYITGVGDF